MKPEKQCMPCLVSFAERTLLYAGVDGSSVPSLAKKILDETPGQWRATPAHYGTYICKQAQKISGKPDPYLEAKAIQNKKGAAILPVLKKLIEESKNRLLTALHIAAIGNVIDLGSADDYCVEDELAGLRDLRLEGGGYGRLEEDIKKSKRLLFVVDNCGEIFFDRALLEIIAESVPEITVAVKSGPIINDATRADALEAGLDRLSTIIETGCDMIGAPLDMVSEDFKRQVMEADVVLGKGHANAETFIDWERGIFLLLKAKCDVVADYLGVKKGDFILKYTG